MARTPENFRTLYCDPGEDFGWATGVDLQLVARGTTKMWTLIDYLWEALEDPTDTSNPLNSADACRNGVATELNTLPIGRIVIENFKIYPWEAEAGNLNWDEVRTARAIGGIITLCRPARFNVPIIFQGADIKKAAVAAGAEEMYDHPLRENRHQNDAIQHFTYFTNTKLLGFPTGPVSNSPEDYE